MATLTEGNRLHDILNWEQGKHYSREKVTVASGESLALGEVVGKISKSTPTTGTADGGNTGDGTCTGVTAGDKAQVGTYTLECIAAETNGGTFKVIAPNGYALPDAEVGTAYASEQLNFTLNDGATDFVVGDKFTITVAEGSGEVVAVDFAAVDGSQDALGFLTDACDASSAAKDAVAIVRDAVINSDNLVWPSGATAAQKAAALAQLADKGIVADRDQV